MMTEVMTFVMKGWYQPGIPAVRINRKSFAIWLSRMKLIAPHKCRIKWSVYSRDSWNNLLFAFPTLVLVLLLRVRWLIGLARSWILPFLAARALQAQVVCMPCWTCTGEGAAVCCVLGWLSTQEAVLFRVGGLGLLQILVGGLRTRLWRGFPLARRQPSPSSSA